MTALEREVYDIARCTVTRLAMGLRQKPPDGNVRDKFRKIVAPAPVVLLIEIVFASWRALHCVGTYDQPVVHNSVFLNLPGASKNSLAKSKLELRLPSLRTPLHQLRAKGIHDFGFLKIRDK